MSEGTSENSQNRHSFSDDPESHKKIFPRPVRLTQEARDNWLYDREKNLEMRRDTSENCGNQRHSLSDSSESNKKMLLRPMRIKELLATCEDDDSDNKNDDSEEENEMINEDDDADEKRDDLEMKNDAIRTVNNVNSISSTSTDNNNGVKQDHPSSSKSRDVRVPHVEPEPSKNLDNVKKLSSFFIEDPNFNWKNHRTVTVSKELLQVDPQKGKKILQTIDEVSHDLGKMDNGVRTLKLSSETTHTTIEQSVATSRGSEVPVSLQAFYPPIDKQTHGPPYKSEAVPIAPTIGSQRTNPPLSEPVGSNPPDTPLKLHPISCRKPLPCPTRREIFQTPQGKTSPEYRTHEQTPATIFSAWRHTAMHTPLHNKLDPDLMTPGKCMLPKNEAWRLQNSEKRCRRPLEETILSEPARASNIDHIPHNIISEKNERKNVDSIINYEVKENLPMRVYLDKMSEVPGPNDFSKSAKQLQQLQQPQLQQQRQLQQQQQQLHQQRQQHLQQQQQLELQMKQQQLELQKQQLEQQKQQQLEQQKQQQRQLPLEQQKQHLEQQQLEQQRQQQRQQQLQQQQLEQQKQQQQLEQQKQQQLEQQKQQQLEQQKQQQLEQQKQQRQQQPQISVSIPTTLPQYGKKISVKDKDYIILGTLGQGMSGEVYRVQDISTLELKAIKYVNLARMDQESAQSCLNEIKMLNKLQAPSVVTMFDHEVRNQSIYVVMEMGESDLSRFLKSLVAEKRVLPITMILHYWTEMLAAVKHIHDNGVIHSDLKPANFLLVRGRLKLIDFGISSTINAEMTSVVKNTTVGTLNYISPEALMDIGGTGDSPQHNNKYKLSYKSDVWSLGCILYSLVYGVTPFHHIRQQWAKINAITSKNPKISYALPKHVDDVPTILIDVMKKCLQHEPKARPSVEQLLKVQYISVARNVPAPSRPSFPASIMLKIKNCLDDAEWRTFTETLEQISHH